MSKLSSTISTTLLLLLFVLGLSACGGSSSGPANTAPKAVANLAVTAASQQVTISWDTPATNAPIYNIYWSNTPGVSKKTVNVNKITNVTSPYVHTGLDNTKTYYYIITQVVGGVESAESLQISASPQAAVPAAPNGLSITATDSQVTITFDALASKPANVLYNIYYSTASTLTKLNGTKIATTSDKFNPASSPSYLITSLKNDGTSYYFVVTAVVNGLESSEGDMLMATPKAAVAAVASPNGTTTPGSFTSPASVTVDTGNQMATVSWGAANAPADTGVSGSGIGTSFSTTPVYTVYVATDINFSQNYKQFANVNSPFKLNGLTNSTPYFFKVTSGVQPTPITTPPASIKNEVSSGIISAIPDTKNPAAPSGVTASQGPQQVNLSWSKDQSGINNTVAPSVSYTIYYSTEPAFFKDSATLKADAIEHNTFITNIPTTSYVHSGLAPNTTYYYVITAVGEGESAPSSIVSVSL